MLVKGAQGVTITANPLKNHNQIDPSISGPIQIWNPHLVITICSAVSRQILSENSFEFHGQVSVAFVFHDNGLQLPVPSQCRQMMKIQICRCMFPEMNSEHQGLTWICYCQTSNINHTLVSNKNVDHSDVVGASPVGAAPTTSSFST